MQTVYEIGELVGKTSIALEAYMEVKGIDSTDTIKEWGELSEIIKKACLAGAASQEGSARRHLEKIHVCLLVVVCDGCGNFLCAVRNPSYEIIRECAEFRAKYCKKIKKHCHALLIE